MRASLLLTLLVVAAIPNDRHFVPAANKDLRPVSSNQPESGTFCRANGTAVPRSLESRGDHGPVGGPDSPSSTQAESDPYCRANETASPRGLKSRGNRGPVSGPNSASWTHRDSDPCSGLDGTALPRGLESRGDRYPVAGPAPRASPVDHDMPHAPPDAFVAGQVMVQSFHMQPMHKEILLKTYAEQGKDFYAAILSASVSNANRSIEGYNKPGEPSGSDPLQIE